MHVFPNSIQAPVGAESVWSARYRSPSQPGIRSDMSCLQLGGPAEANGVTVRRQRCRRQAKRRLRWTPQLHTEFLRACKFLGGPYKATPKQILVLMGVQGLSLVHVKSHLQRYRHALLSLNQPPEREGRVTACAWKQGTPPLTGELSESGTLECNNNTPYDEEGAFEVPAQLGECTSNSKSHLQWQEKGSAAWTWQSPPDALGISSASSASLRGVMAIRVQHTLNAQEKQQIHSSVKGKGEQDNNGSAFERKWCVTAGNGEDDAGGPPVLVSGPMVLPAQHVPLAGSSFSSDMTGSQLQQRNQVQGTDANQEDVDKEHSLRMEEVLAIQQELQQDLQQALETQRSLQNRLMAHGEFIQSLKGKGDPGHVHPPLSSLTSSSSPLTNRKKCSATPCTERVGAIRRSTLKRSCSPTKAPALQTGLTQVLHLHDGASSEHWKIAGPQPSSAQGILGTRSMKFQREEGLSSPSDSAPLDPFQLEPSEHSAYTHAY